MDHGGSVPQPVMESPAETESSDRSLRPSGGGRRSSPRREPLGRGFGDPGRSRAATGRGRKRKGKGLSRADWGPLGKHPDLEAIVARQRLHLPLSGRLSEAQVNRAWKAAAAQHHPDRGGEHDTMQAINGARDLLLGRGED
jgi:hypothetical protein